MRHRFGESAVTLMTDVQGLAMAQKPALKFSSLGKNPLTRLSAIYPTEKEPELFRTVSWRTLVLEPKSDDAALGFKAGSCRPMAVDLRL